MTSLRASRAGAPALPQTMRGHWIVENVYWVRDVTFDEDRCRVRTSGEAQVLAALRNVAITLFRQAGSTNMAAATRECARRPEVASRLIGAA